MKSGFDFQAVFLSKGSAIETELESSKCFYKSTASAQLLQSFCHQLNANFEQNTVVRVIEVGPKQTNSRTVDSITSHVTDRNESWCEQPAFPSSFRARSDTNQIFCTRVYGACLIKIR